MLVDEIIRALRDPEYRLQLTNEVRGGALPDGSLYDAEHPESEQEQASES